ncbi:MAG TPA: alpha-amylase family glycosyl hydrolase, partial [Syntrophales bacterium]|nr:alpha-amylase family glycosyl hydrolase [Syntrophales bacterium]
MNPEPTATYRVQLGPGFGFDEAAGIVPYLDGLGVSHLYTSPSFQAAAGSTHGYDVADPGRVSADLGGAVAHARLGLLLKKTGLGHMIDLVPHHMAVADRRNPWWWDVLENGPASPFA